MTCVLHHAEGRFILTAGPRYTDLVRQIPGMLYDKQNDVWHSSAKFSIAVATRGILGDYLELTPEAIMWAEEAKNFIRTTDLIKAGQMDFRPPDPAFPLWHFQEVGRQYLTIVGRVLLADEMGTGKTVQALTALEWLDYIHTNGGAYECPFPALIVCTNSMKWTWKREIEKWLPWVSTITVVNGTAAQRKKQLADFGNGDADLSGICIVNWEALRLHSRLAPYGSVELKESEKIEGELNRIKWATVIADEAHRGKDPTSKVTRALWQTSKDAEYRWALTGTPITGKAEDLWSVMHFVDPQGWPVRSKWIDRYAIPSVDVRGHFKTAGFNRATEPELHAILRPQFLRRTKAEVLPDLPPKVYRQMWVELGTKQAKAYDQMSAQMIAALDSGLLIASNGVVEDMRLGQIASAMPVLDDNGQVVSLEMPSCKVDALFDILDETEDQIVVGAESRLLIELCSRELDRKKISHVLVTGHVSTEDRERNVAAFQAGNARVCLCTLGAGAEGITLTAAPRLVFLQRSFRMTANLQFQDRIHRIGQEAPQIDIIDVLTTGTTDEDRWEISNDKEQVAQVAYKDPAYLKQRLVRRASK